MEPNNLDRLLQVGTDGPAVEKARGRKKHPEGWTPGVAITRDGGYVVTDPREQAPTDWAEILDELLPPGVDRDRYDVDGDTVEVRAWDANTGGGETTRLYYFKARIRRRSALADAGIDLDDIVATAKKAKVKTAKPVDAERAYFVHITDLQAGQGDGNGVAGMVARVLDVARLVDEDLTALKKCGRPASHLFVPITGDLVEGIWGWYATQTFSVELDRREQVKLVRRLLTELLLSLAEYGLPVHIAVVPGNHGENRKDGKAFTSLGDNDDVAIVEQIAEAFSLVDSLRHVTFSFPSNERLSLTVEVMGHIVGLTHGHVARAGGAGVEGKILNWFKTMAATRDPIGDADILFTGHYHHARFQQLVGDTVWIQGGALCDASDWFSQALGLVSDPVIMKGTITRDAGVEQVLPFWWSRTRPVSEVVA